MITLSFVIFCVTVFGLVYFVKYNKLCKKVEKTIFELKEPLRHGYIKRDLEYKKDLVFQSVIFVKEIERFNNGESRVEIEKIESGICDAKVPQKAVESYIREEFISIVKTNDVTWLEIEQSIKEIRKSKLAKLRESIKIGK